MSTKDSDRTDGINGFAGTGPAKKEKETTDGVKDTDKGSNRVTEAPVVRPSTFALPLLPTTPLQREIETTGHVRATILHKNKDDTIDNPPRLFDDEHGAAARTAASTCTNATPTRSTGSARGTRTVRTESTRPSSAHVISPCGCTTSSTR